MRITNCEVIDPGTGERFWGSVEWQDGIITEVRRVAPGFEEDKDAIDGRGHLLAPSFFDLWTDFCEPGHEVREDISSGAAAAAAGGFSCVCVRPDTDPVIDSADTVRFVIERGKMAQKASVFPLGALSAGLKGETMACIGEMAEAGVRAVTEGDRWIARTGLLRRCLEYAGNFGLTVMLTNEDPALVEGIAHEGFISTIKGLRATPSAAEEIAVARHVALAELTGTPVHLVKISSAAGVRIVAAAKTRGLPVTASVSVLHLVLDDSAVATYDQNAKVWPPLRSEDDRKALLAAVADGTIDAIVSDHAPRAIEDKEVEYDLAVPGASTIEMVFSLVNGLVMSGKLPLSRAISALSLEPRRIMGVEGGIIAKGQPADLVLLDRAVEWRVEPDSLISRGKNTPFLGQTLLGRPVMTIRNGVVIFNAL